MPAAPATAASVTYRIDETHAYVWFYDGRVPVGMVSFYLFGTVESALEEALKVLHLGTYDGRDLEPGVRLAVPVARDELIERGLPLE